MSDDTCILTTKDLTILEIMLERCMGQDDPLRPILKRKMDGALVMFRDDIPENVATLGSRVTFRVNGGEPDSRIITSEAMTSPIGLYLPITYRRGLALLGLAAGQEFVLRNADGEERIMLEEVLYQPEAAKRRQRAEAMADQHAFARPALRLVHDSGSASPGPAFVRAGRFDDPGPSAA